MTRRRSTAAAARIASAGERRRFADRMQVLLLSRLRRCSGPLGGMIAAALLLAGIVTTLPDPMLLVGGRGDGNNLSILALADRCNPGATAKPGGSQGERSPGGKGCSLCIAAAAGATGLAPEAGLWLLQPETGPTQRLLLAHTDGRPRRIGVTLPPALGPPLPV